MKTPISFKTLRKHLLYYSWMYILLAVLTIFGWNLVFTMTAYRPPQEKIIDLYGYGIVDMDGLNAYWHELRDRAFPDMEQMDASTLMSDETYGAMILMTRVAAGEGDIYLLPKDEFTSYAGQGVLAPLDNVPKVMDVIQAAGINTERGVIRETESGERRLFGVPISQLPGLEQYMLIPTNEYYVCVLSNNQNEERVMDALAYFLQDMAKAPEDQ